MNIENRTYYFYNDLINVLNFEANNLRLDKKSWKDIDIYYFGYVDKDEPTEWKVNSVNPLYLILIFCFAGEKNRVRYLNIDNGDAVLKKYDQVFSGIKHHIGKISGDEIVYDSDYDKIKFLTDDSLPLGKLIHFPAITIAIRCVFKQDGIYYPQVYLDDALYQIFKRIDCGEFIDHSGSGVKCMICHYSYFSDGFKYQPYVCNGCHDFSMTVMNLSDFFVVTIKGVDYRVYISGAGKKAAVFILKNSELGNK